MKINGPLLRSARCERYLNQSQLAELAGCDAATVRRAERGNISHVHYVALINAMNSYNISKLKSSYRTLEFDDFAVGDDRSSSPEVTAFTPNDDQRRSEYSGDSGTLSTHGPLDTHSHAESSSTAPLDHAKEIELLSSVIASVIGTLKTKDPEWTTRFLRSMQAFIATYLGDSAPEYEFSVKAERPSNSFLLQLHCDVHAFEAFIAAFISRKLAPLGIHHFEALNFVLTPELFKNIANRLGNLETSEMTVSGR